MKCQNTYHDQSHNSDNGHENARPLAQSKRVDLHEWLRSTQGEKRVDIRCAEQEQYSSCESENACEDRATQDSTSCDDAGILCLFCDVSRGVEPSQSSSSEQTGNKESGLESRALHVYHLDTYKDSIQFHPGGAPVPL